MPSLTKSPPRHHRRHPSSVSEFGGSVFASPSSVHGLEGVEGGEQSESEEDWDAEYKEKAEEAEAKPSSLKVTTQRDGNQLGALRSVRPLSSPCVCISACVCECMDVCVCVCV